VISSIFRQNPLAALMIPLVVFALLASSRNRKDEGVEC
jgi:hypothetical protein